MSVEDAIITAGSAAVVAFLIFMAWAIGFGKALALDEAALAREVAQSEPGAHVAETAIAADQRSALARLTDGRLVIARAMGDGVSLRILPANAVRLSVKQSDVSVRFADLGYPAVKLRLGSPAPPWLAALAHGDAP